MADVTLTVTPLPGKAIASPVEYDFLFVLSNTLSKTGVVPVDVYINERADSLLICSCPIPMLSITSDYVPVYTINGTAIQEIRFTSAVAQNDCEDC